jgi:hypothetical protein
MTAHLNSVSQTFAHRAIALAHETLEIEAAAFHKAGLRFQTLALTAKGIAIGNETNA